MKETTETDIIININHNTNGLPEINILSTEEIGLDTRKSTKEILKDFSKMNSKTEKL
jgi:hypothetical protein